MTGPERPILDTDNEVLDYTTLYDKKGIYVYFIHALSRKKHTM
jgi:hypothetical protein